MNAIATEFTAASEEAPRTSLEGDAIEHAGIDPATAHAIQLSTAEWHAAHCAKPIRPLPPLTDVGVTLNPDLATAIAVAEKALDGYEQVARQHTSAEIADDGAPERKAAWEAADEAFQEYLEEVDEALSAIMDAPAYGDEKRHRAAAYIRAAHYRATRNEHWTPISAVDAAAGLPDDMPSADIEFGRVIADLLEPPATDAWDAAYAAYMAVKGEYDALSAKEDVARAEMAAHCPDELTEIRFGERRERWHSMKAFDADKEVFGSDRERLGPLLQDWLDRSAPAQRLLHELSKSLEPADDAVNEAEEALMEVVPPTPAALVAKLTIQARECDDYKRGYEDAGLVALHLGHYMPERYAVRNFLDALAMAGVTEHPALLVGDWRPRAWVGAFAQAGGFVSMEWGEGLRLGQPRGGDHPFDVAAAAALAEELVQTPWKMRAVFLFAEHRKAEGDDPAYTSLGDEKPRGFFKPVIAWAQASDYEGKPITPRIRFDGEPK